MAAIDKELKLFRELMLWLFESQEKPWEYTDDRALTIYNEIQHAYRSVQREELEILLPTDENVNVQFDNVYLYLKPVTHGLFMVPVISLSKCDFGQSMPETRLRLGLFSKHGNEIKAFGYRFEPPEGVGQHNYYHVQIINSLGNVPFPNYAHMSWLPDRQPAFPLDANNAVKLILTLLITLYDLNYVSRLKANPSFGSDLDKYLSEMHCYSFSGITWYWEVGIGNPISHLEHYSTEKPPAMFGADLRKKYPKCQITGMSKGRYGSLPTRQRLTD